MNRDRGTIKWNAMMLPEHVKLLRDWQAEDQYEIKPDVDEWAQQELAEQLQIAYKNHVFIELTYWLKGKIYTERGYVEAIKGQVLTFKEKHLHADQLVRIVLFS